MKLTFHATGNNHMENPRIDRAIAAALGDPKHGLRLQEVVGAYENDAIVITDVEAVTGPHIVYVNEAFERMTGYSAAEVLGRAPRFMQGPATSREATAMIRSALAAWKPITVELVNYSRAGHQFWVELTIVPVANDAGWLTHWIAIQRNVSARRAAQAAASHAAFVETQDANLSREIGERTSIAARLEFTSSHDALTGLCNRSYFMEQIAKACARVRPGDDASFALLYLDLDRFKVVNYNLGHVVGDALLQQIAERFNATLQNRCLLARLGGDEFAVFLESSNGRAHAIELARNLLEALRRPIAVGAAPIAINASIGIVTGMLGSVTSEEMLRDADVAMYRAKKSGSGGFAVFDETMHSEALSTYRLHHDLRRAIASDEFVVYYQPLVRLTTGETIGFEALVRWRHPERGIVAPAEFVAVAEEIGAIVPIGESVLRQACAAWQHWPPSEFGGEPLKVSVNVSSVQLLDSGFAKMLTAIAREFALPPSVLQIEVTESVLIGDAVRTRAMLEEIRAAGISVALDDFGTGYSSLSYLELFPIDVIKVDRSFVSRLASGRRNVNVLKTIAELAMTLEMEIVAEGIETGDELDILLALGFKSGQGYLFAKPMPENTVVHWLAAAADRKRA